MSVYTRLQELGITLPRSGTPVASFAMATQSGTTVYVSGHIARHGGAPWSGRLGADLTTADGQAATRAIAIDIMATLHGFLGSLDRVRRILRIECLVTSDPAFTEQHLVANGASDLLLSVFGERGRHARAAYGVAQIPLGACAEITAIVEVDRPGPPA